MSDIQDTDFIKLNVGGEIFCTSLQTLMHGDNLLSGMFSEKIPIKRSKDGSVFIDRPGTHFQTILNFLRDGTISEPSTKKEIDEIRREAEFYCTDPLVKFCEKLQRKETFGKDFAQVRETSYDDVTSDGNQGIVLLIPLMENGTLSLACLRQTFEIATGLCYIDKNIGKWPVMNKVVGDVIYPSQSGWHNTEYFVVPFVSNNKNETNMNVNLNVKFVRQSNGYDNGFKIYKG